MEKKEIIKLLEIKMRSSYVMDKCLVWFFWKYREYKEKLNEFKTTLKYSEDPRIDEMFKDVRWLSLSQDLSSLQMALIQDVNTINSGEVRGEKIKIKNPEEEAKFRNKLLKEIKKEKDDLELLEPKKEDNELLNVIGNLRRRVEMLENKFE